MPQRLLSIFLLCLLATSSLAKEPRRKRLKAGNPFPTDLEFVMLDGTKKTIADFKGKVVLIDFWATWCAPCIEETPNLKKAVATWKDEPFEILGVSFDENAEDLTTFINDKKVTWPMAVEPEGFDSEMAKKLRVNGIPKTYLVDTDGKIIAVDAFAFELDEVLQATFKGEGITTTEDDHKAPKKKKRGKKKDRAPAPFAGGVSNFENPVHDRSIGDLIESALGDETHGAKFKKGVDLWSALETSDTNDLSALPLKVTQKPEQTPYQRATAATLVISSGSYCKSCEDWHTSDAGGVIISNSGLAVTNYHVLEVEEDSDQVIAITADGRAVAVETILAADKKADIALIQLEAGDYPAVKLAPQPARVLEDIFAVSHPDGNFYVFTKGVVSRYSRGAVSQVLGGPTSWLEITADFAYGSSGCGIFNRNGELVGIVESTESLGIDDPKRPDSQMVLKRCVAMPTMLRLMEVTGEETAEESE